MATKANPDDAIKREIAELKDSLRRLDTEVMNAINARNWTTADKLDQQRNKVSKRLYSLLGKPVPAHRKNPAAKSFPVVRVVSRTVKKNPGFTKRTPSEAAEYKARVMRESNSAAIEYIKSDERATGVALEYFVLIAFGPSEPFKLIAAFKRERTAAEYAEMVHKNYTSAIVKVAKI